MSRLPIDANDMLGLVGLALLGWGLWLYWPPLALMSVGGLLLALSLAREILRLRQ